MEKFDWKHTISAPKGYPVEVYRGKLKGLTENDYSASMRMFGISNAGWGRPGRTVVVGPDLKAVPASLELTWLSFRENKFYTGAFELPREKMIKLFLEGFYDYRLNRQRTYDEIVVGMAPGGVVVVWLLGVQTETEVTRFQAKETHIDINNVSDEDYYMFEDDYVDFILNSRKIAKAEIPFGLWDKYREKYSWRVHPVFPEGFRLIQQRITFYNGEKEHIFTEQPDHDAYKKRALPLYNNFSWYDEKGNKFGVDVYYDEEEVFKAFEEIYKEDKQQDVDLVFELQENRKDFYLALRNKTKEYELRKVKGNIFPMSKDKPKAKP